MKRALGRKLRWVLLHLFRNADMRRLHDALAEANLAGTYRIACGTLLGWAREGRLLPWDPDVDFFMSSTDRALMMERGQKALRAAGFRPVRLFRNNQGEITELSFARHLCQYDFFFTFPSTEPGVSEYFTYTWGRADDAGSRVQITSSFRDQDWDRCELVGRTWMKPADHVSELDAQYGSWRVRQKDFVHTESTNRKHAEPWHVQAHVWTENEPISLSASV